MNNDINRLCLACMEYGLDERGVCTLCGADANAPAASPHHLPPRSVLGGKYLAARVLGEGGFGITYLGWDINLEVKVAIKEFYPLGAVTRDSTITDNVSVLTGNMEEFFNKGRDRFVEEARSLAKFHNLPGIVSVRDFFLENGTAYIVMEFVEGVTLKEHLERSGGRMAEAQVLELFRPLVHSLAAVHRAGIIHRDISPDNLMLTPEGTLRLLDFGAARDFNDDNKSLSVLLKPGYAPEEQYRSRGKQGPWTDVYALSATMYRALEGEKPPEAMERLLEDTLGGLSAGVSARTAGALMKGLAVRGQDRWQSMDELYTALYETPATAAGGVGVAPAAAATPAPAAQPKPQKQPGPAPERPKTTRQKRLPLFIGAGALAVVVLVAVVLGLGSGGESPFGASGAGVSSGASVPEVEKNPDGLTALPLGDGAAAWTGSERDTIVIGSVLDIGTQNGTARAAGIELAVQEINDMGGVHGKPLEHICYDGLEGQEGKSSSVEERVALYKRMIAYESPAAVIIESGGSGLESFIDEADLIWAPVMGLISADNIERYAENPYLFAPRCSPENQAVQLAAFAAQSMQAARVSAIYPSSSLPGGETGSVQGELFLQTAADLGLEIGETLVLSKNSVVVPADEVQAVVDSNPEVIFVPGTLPDVGPAGSTMPSSRIFEQLQAAGFTGTVLGDDMWMNDVHRWKDYGFTIRFVQMYKSAYSLGHRWREFEDFHPEQAARYEASSPSERAYEAVYLIASAINNAGTDDPAAVAAALRNVQWRGLTGDIRYSDSQIPERTMWLMSSLVTAENDFVVAPEGRVGLDGGFTLVTQEEASSDASPEDFQNAPNALPAATAPEVQDSAPPPAATDAPELSMIAFSGTSVDDDTTYRVEIRSLVVQFAGQVDSFDLDSPLVSDITLYRDGQPIDFVLDTKGDGGGEGDGNPHTEGIQSHFGFVFEPLITTPGEYELRMTYNGKEYRTPAEFVVE